MQSGTEVIQQRSPQSHFLKWVAVASMIYLILLAVGMIGSGFKWASGGKDGAAELFAFATNPFMGLIIGALATALIQSSSTVTSVIVGLVAGGLPVETAIPMIMGANIGTTITNTLVSLAHAGKRKEFRRAFAAAVIHDFFNLMAVAIFLPLEIMFGILAKVSFYLSNLLVGGDSVSIKSLNFIKPITKPVVSVFKDLLHDLPGIGGGVALAAIGLVMIFVSITFLGKLLKTLMVGRAKELLHKAIGRGPVGSIASGTLVTIAVQSSSTTTSLIIPLAGNGLFKLKEIYPFTLGANIGTCITALLAATAVSGPAAGAALQIALVHFCYNTLSVVVIYGTPFLRQIPLKAARLFAHQASKHKWIALVYMIVVFFLLPISLIMLTK
ncbi:Na/Pi symporter [Pelagibaculum spongiae]|uniref:Sodium:phosphate symporter n=1 Tax=Pelagibaculum spongiae TaxID=2080658 RepID=A0A2V1GUL0_9GAMM|nr:Na/Pi symporter [Pelagibaculum spongiae]PVZ62964.1 sodium:phosphate symporter [Pelagibaculum spongiae]